MSTRKRDLWQGIDPATQKALSARDYRRASFAQELSQRGVDASELVVADHKQGKNVGGHRTLAYITGSQYTLGGPTVDSTGLSSPVTLIGAISDSKFAVVRDATGKTANVKFANIGVPLNPDGTLSTVKDWPRASEVKDPWIPGVEVFARKIHRQRHRGFFGEFVRRDDGILAKIGLWPKQWSAARMFANTAKGFHVHPPSIPEGSTAADWLRRLFVDEPDNYSLRRYDDEQWDVMFFLQGRVEMILCDVRAGLPRRVMRFFIDGDNHPGKNNAGVVIPPGVTHAIRVEGSEDVIMVYGTSTIFHPEFEGRIASEIETAELPLSWQTFLDQPGKREIR
jgi:dTDP-4-dehydrorhamnose 3,5-epimerase-like enzyme